MLHIVSYEDYKNTARTFERDRTSGNRNLANRALELLTTHWLETLPPAQVSILLFVWGRTLRYHKRGQQIFRYQFNKGVEKKGEAGRVSCGLGMAENTLRTHLNALIEDDFLTVYASKTEGSASENIPRIYEINFTKLESFLPNRRKDHGDIMLPTPKKPRDSANVSGKLAVPKAKNMGGQMLRTPAAKNDPHNNIYKRLSKDNQSGHPPEPRSLDYSEEVSTVIQSISGKHQTARVSRIKSASALSPHLVSRESLQAMIDVKVKELLPGAIRMMVTDKSFGMWRKRVKENPPTDLSRFLDHVIGYWHEIAKAHSAAIRRNGTEAKSKPLPLSPDFTSLAFRYPYFLKVFDNHRLQGEIGQKEKKRDREMEELQRKLEASNNAVQALRRTRRPSAPAPSRIPALRRAATDVRETELDDELPPSWADHEKRASNG